MKKLIGFLSVITSIAAFGQFPEPTNFEFSYDYIMIDESDYCAGQWVYGPTYCSHFSWTSPDTNSTSSTLEYYNLYYSHDPQSTMILTTTTDLYFDMEIGILGEIWVTAVYSNPHGESAPSNIIKNEDLPISVNEIPSQDKLNIYYDNTTQEIKIINGESISQINIFNCRGELISSNKTNMNRINIKNLTTGLYIIEITNNDQNVIRQKIIK